jgi:tetrahedral aminopeptidase
LEPLAKRLAEAFGVSGFEDEIRAAIRDEITGLADTVETDVLGNLVAVRKGTGGGKRVMVAAHMDQIGVMITHIDDKGFMRFAPLGGVFPLTCWGSQVRFMDGTVGTIGLDGRVDRRGSVPELRDMYVDVGATSRADVKQKVGDVAQFWPGFAAQGNAWFSPNMDDRAGCIALAQLLKDLQGVEIKHDLYAVFTTQEEVGVRGARTSAYAAEPDIAIALDVTLTGDTPYARPVMDVYMGRGVAIKVQDSGMISHVGLNRALMAAAEAEGIPYQLEVLAGGTTDASAMQMTRAGVPASCLSFPSRHVHCPSQIVDRRDVEGAVRLLAALLKRDVAL